MIAHCLLRLLGTYSFALFPRSYCREAIAYCSSPIAYRLTLIAYRLLPHQRLQQLRIRGVIAQLPKHHSA